MNTHKDDSLGGGLPVRRAARMRGAVLVFVAISMVSCIAFAVLTMDIGMIALTKIQLQNAADAAALAGASALINGDQDEARRRAIAVAGENLAWRDGFDPVVIVDGDVTFPTSTRVRVETHRTEATGDALRTFFIRTINTGENRLANARAVAEAEIYDVCGGPCFMPFAPVDRWDELHGPGYVDGEYDHGEPFNDSNANGQYEVGEPFTDENGNGIRDPEEPYDPVGTGYRPPNDVGLRVTLERGHGNNHYEPSLYFLICLYCQDTSCGGRDIEEDIKECCDRIISLGDVLDAKHGGTVGPAIKHGVEELIGRDPNAYWDGASNSVQGSTYGTSPRVVKIALFDPRSQDHEHVIVSNLGAFFLENVTGGGKVTGRYMGLITQGEPCAGEGEPTWLSGLHLVR